MCHRFTLLTEGLGKHRLFPKSVRLLGGLFTPSLQRIPPLPMEKSFAIVVGDSSLALVEMNGSRVTKKRSFGDELQAALENEHRCSGVELSMLWGQGLGYIYDRIETLIKKHAPRHPEGFDIYISWTGNDVYGKWGYKAFTWHHQSPWVKETAEMAKKAYEWPIKQLRQVQTDVQKVCALANRPGINSITLISGPENGINYGLPEEYDEEMSRHAKVMAEHGIALIDPFPLLQATDRPDRFHTSLTAEHLSTTVNWYKALISATVVNRLVVDLRSEMVANRREVVFYEHFHLNKPDSRLKIPGLKDLLIKPTRDEEVPPVARDDDEQIVLNVPLLAPQQDLPLTEGEDVSEVDRILLDTTPGAENIVQVENDDSSTAVLITKLQFDRQGDEEATEEEIALANSLGIFALDLSDERTSGEAAATTATVFKGIEDLTDEELRKSVVYTLPRGSVGISIAMKEMNLGQPLSKALTKGVQKGSSGAGLNLSTKALPPVPPKKAPQPKATSSTDTDVFIRPTDLPGKASASTPKEPVQPPPKKMPVQRAPSPAAKAAAKPAALPASPPGREGTWIKGTDLPPLSAGTRPITDEKKRRLGGKCTFILRGFTNKPENGDRTPNIRLRAGDLSADWEEFLSALGQIWRGLRVSDIMQVFQQPPDGTARYEVFAKITSEHEIEVLRVRCMQGHSGEMLSDHVDILETHAAVHTFVDWDASLTTRPKIGAYDLYSVSFQQFPHKLGYHGTYQRNFADITKYGLVPGVASPG